MKKKLFFCVIFIFCRLIALNAVEPKEYYDYYGNYIGVGCAVYYGTSDKWNIEEMCYRTRTKDKGIPYHKLSKDYRFLIQSALEEYDVKKGEVYVVIAVIAEGSETLNAYIEITKVVKDGVYFDYCAYTH